MKNHFSIAWRVAIVTCLAIVLSLGLPQRAQAVEINNKGLLQANETINDDFFISGKDVIIDGTVNGMVFATGETVTVNGTINGDLIAMGSQITLGEKGKITGNVFTGGSKIEVKAPIEGSLLAGASGLTLGEKAQISRNLYFGGFSITSLAGSKVTQDMLIGGYQAILNGEVGRDLRVSSAALELNGSVKRDVLADVEAPSASKDMSWTKFMPKEAQMPDAIATGMRIGSQAKIGGKMTYTSPAEQATAIQTQPSGGVVYQTPVPVEKPEKAKPTLTTQFPILDPFFKGLRELVTLLLLGALALWLFPGVLNQVVDQARLKPAPAAGYGFVTILAGYALLFIAALMILGIGLLVGLVTLGGLSQTIFGLGFSGLAAIGAIFTFLVGYGSQLIISYMAGSLVLKAIFPDRSVHRAWNLVVGVVIFVILHSLPFLGWLIGLATSLMGIGAIWLYYRSRRTPAAAPAELPAA